MKKSIWIWLIGAVVLVALALMVLTNDSTPDAGPEPPPPPPPPTADGAGQTADTPDRTVGSRLVPDSPAPSLKVSLSEGQGEDSVAASLTAVRRVEGRELSEQEIRAVTDRLPTWEVASSTTEFKFPEESLPPPRSGTTIDNAFPPAQSATPVEPVAQPLEVLRVQPEGSVGIAPFVSITFNQAMVPLGTIEQIDAEDLGVTITPELPGRWQWIGTRTLRFEHDQSVFDRLPMATSYVVEVSADTTALSGTQLSETVRFEFETPAPTLLSLEPLNDSVRSNPVFVATFDQRIDPAAVLEAITFTVGNTTRQLRLASDAEISADEDVKRITQLAYDNTWVAFVPVGALDPDSAVTIRVGPTVPSLEGAKTSTDSVVKRGRTFGSLGVQEVNCSREFPCQADYWLNAYFNNELDPTTLDVDDVQISPEIAGARVSVNYDSVQINGELLGDTVYEVTFPASLADVFGQTLGEPLTVEFHIASPYPVIQLTADRFATLNPFADTQELPVLVRGHEQLRVRLYKVTSQDIVRYINFWRSWELSWERNTALPEPPGRLFSDEVVGVEGDINVISEQRIDLRVAIGGEYGHVIAVVEGVGSLATLEREDPYYWSSIPLVVWVQSTNLGVDAISRDDQVVVWATNLKTGDVVRDVQVDFVGREESAVTDDQGLASIELGGEADAIVATNGDDQAILLGAFRLWQDTNDLTWYTIDDRGTYRPGETVHLKGWVRSLDLRGQGDLELLDAGQLVTYTANDSLGNELTSGSVRLDEHGGFDLAFDLDERSNLGWAGIDFQLPGSFEGRWNYHPFEIQEFRRPEFEVTTRLTTAGPFFVGEAATVAVDANYFAGGPLPNAKIDWTVSTSRGFYSPPNWNNFTFGLSRLEWDSNPYISYADFPMGTDIVRETFNGTTNTSGSHFLRMDFAGSSEELPTVVSAQAAVTDVNRQQWIDSSEVLVHAGELYVGVRSTSPYVKSGNDITVEAIVVDVDGNARPDTAIELVAARVVSELVDGDWREVIVSSQACEVISKSNPSECVFEADIGGKYRVDARVRDANGRSNRSAIDVWVAGAANTATSRRIQRETVELLPDAETYEAGETAEILVVSPIETGTGLLIVGERISTFEVGDFGAVLEVPITEADVPELTVRVEIVGSAVMPEDTSGLEVSLVRPAFASGEVSLRVPPLQQTLNITAQPANPVTKPGDSTTVSIAVKDAAGKAVSGADVLLVVVDEAVLAVSDYQFIDPIDVFYRSRWHYLDVTNLRYSVLMSNALDGIIGGNPFYLGENDSMLDSGAVASQTVLESAQLGDMSLLSAQFPLQQQIQVRENLDALAVFDPHVTTNAAGEAEVDFTLPDNLSRYRIMVIATDGASRFGSTEGSLTASLPLQVRPSPPRFLNFGDHFELPVVVQNSTDENVEVDVVAQAANLNLSGVPGRRVTVPANDRVEVRFAATSKDVGTAHLRVAAVTEQEADAQEFSFPVYTPATKEAFATYGVLDGGLSRYEVQQPQDVFANYGGLEITTSSTALQALTDAVIYLNEYSYQSADAYASRILAFIALRDVLSAFEGAPTTYELDATIRRDIEELAMLAHNGGGFGRWSARSAPSPYSSIQAMHALLTADNAGFEVPREVINAGKQYLRTINRHISSEESESTKDFLRSYALHVRALGGDQVEARAQDFWQQRGGDLGIDALAYLWPLVSEVNSAEEIERIINNSVTETAAGATMVTDTSEDDYLILASNTRSDALILHALITMTPQSDLIPKLVDGLLASKVKGRWNNVQENAFVVLALHEYFKRFEAVNPDFVARVWLDDQYIAEHTYSGRNTDRNSTFVPPIVEGRGELVLQKDGSGRLYYRLGLSYAPKNLLLAPLDRGFVVQRSFEALDNPSDVYRDGDGNIRVVAGASVAVKLTVVNDSRRSNMVLVDPLAAGFEPVNQSLAVSPLLDTPTSEPADSWAWEPRWFEHENKRDERVEVYSSLLPAGTHEYSYVVRATTPGRFVVPPARAEEIYTPEVFGRSQSQVVIVEDASAVS